MSATVVYLGPSLARSEAAAIVATGVSWRPPARRGDLPAAVAAGARRIAIIDGEFGQSLAVSVLEVKAALARGVEIWGASSMGALRAAECAALGMQGFGWIFGGYRDGWLAADDEVALLFNPWSGEAATIPLVNIRWSLLLAAAAGAVADAAAPALLATAKAVRFEERTPEGLRAAARLTPWEAQMHALVRWMEQRPEQCDRKRLDALELLHALAWRGESAECARLSA